jgi:hypothetical protein
MSYLLEACRSYPISPDVFAQLRAMPEWTQAVEWGWVMERTGDLTGMGRAHAPGGIKKGIVRD